MGTASSEYNCDALAWTEQAVARLKAGAPGAYGFSLFAISRENLLRLRSLHIEYVRAMQALIAQPQVNECVGLYCAQLLDLDCTSDNVFATEPKSDGRSRPEV
jgi:hypothetical protein